MKKVHTFFDLIFISVLLFPAFALAQNWNIQTSGTTNILYGVSFANVNTGTVVGASGIILRTVNGGGSWVSQTSGTTNNIYGVAILDTVKGSTAGRAAFRWTTDGGTNWNGSNYTGTIFDTYLAVTFINQDRRVAAGQNQSTGGTGKIAITINGGVTWGAKTTNTNIINDVSFSDTLGTAVGNSGTILRSTDGGNTWTTQTSGTTANLYGVSCTDFLNVVVVGANGTILRTTDGGTNWTSQTSGTTNVLRGVSLIDANYGTAVGDVGTILRTTDGGNNWISEASGVTNTLRRVYLLDANTGTAVGDGGTILHRTPPLVLNLTALIQGFYNGSTMVPDTVTLELHNATTPYALVESKTGVLSTSGVGTFTFTTAVNGTPYYIAVKSANTIETWSTTAQSFTSGSLSYDFTTAAAQAYGSNMIQIGSKWCIYSGDVTQDGKVDGSDLSAVYTDANNFAGAGVTDLTGDKTVDGSDLSIVYNNSNNFVSRAVPPGAPVAKLIRRPVKLQENNIK